MFVRETFSFFLIFALNIANINASLKDLGRIVNGVDENINNIPYQVAIFPGETLCGGSILNKDWILTAAHCTDGLTKDQIEFAIGVQDIRNLKTKDYLKVSQLAQHPHWNSKTKDNDIALIKAAVPITFTSTIKKIDIQKEMPKDDSPVVVSGYGDPYENAEDPTYVLKSAELLLVNFKTCNDAYQKGLTDNMICAGVPKHDKDTCQGDSGGPLTYNGNLLGVTSFGDGCGGKDPGVYAKVLNYIPWMTEITKIQF